MWAASFTNEQIELSNELIRRRWCASFNTNNGSVSVKFEKPLHELEGSELGVIVSMGEDDNALNLSFSRSATWQLVGSVIWSRLSPPLQIQYMNHVLSELLTALSTLLATPVTVVGVEPNRCQSAVGTSNQGSGLLLALEFRSPNSGAETCGQAFVQATPSALSVLIRCLKRSEARPVQITPAPLVPLMATLDSVAMASEDFADLERSDVIVLEATRTTRQAHLRLSLGKGPVFEGRLNNGCVTVTDVQPNIKEVMNMKDTEHDDEKSADTTTELSFELGQLDVALDELAKVESGYTFRTNWSPTEPAVTIRVADRRIGRGRLVIVGNVIGVQIDQWSNDG